MPSHRREQAGPALQLQAQFSYSLPCTPQAHCRSAPLTPLVDMESWFHAATPGFESTRNCGSPAGLSNFQQPSEMPMGAVDDGVEISTGSVFPIVDFQSDNWWPPINVQAIRRDILTPQRGIGETKPAASNVTFTTGYTMEPWCHEISNPVAVANVDMCDLNAPNCEHPASAMAVVSIAPSSSPAAPASTRAKSTRKGKSVSAPTSPSELRPSREKSLAVQKKSNCKRPVSQRENHIWSERQRRKGMNYLFSTLRSLLPHPTSKTDKSTVVGEIIKYIQSLQVKLEMLTKKRQQVMAARTLSAFHSIETMPKAFVSNGLTLVDHSSDPSSMTAITALPPPGRESCLQSYLGANVGLHVCGLNVFITTSSPRGRRGLLQQLLVTIHKHDLDVINANISTSNASIFHCLHCQASQDAELLNNDLHSTLQSVISSFGAQV